MMIPWSCHVCSGKFDKYRGGVCARCKRSACLRHLNLIGFTKEQGPAKSEQIVCVNCIKAGETSAQLLQELLFRDCVDSQIGSLTRQVVSFMISQKLCR